MAKRTKAATQEDEYIGPTRVATTTGPRRLQRNRLDLSRGASVASASNITLGTDGNIFAITGTTTINHITLANWNAGPVFLHFNTSLTVTHNGGSVPAGSAAIFLAGGANFSATVNDTLGLIYDGTVWREFCRTAV